MLLLQSMIACITSRKVFPDGVMSIPSTGSSLTAASTGSSLLAPRTSKPFSAPKRTKPSFSISKLLAPRISKVFPALLTFKTLLSLYISESLLERNNFVPLLVKQSSVLISSTNPPVLSAELSLLSSTEFTLTLFKLASIGFRSDIDSDSSSPAFCSYVPISLAPANESEKIVNNSIKVKNICRLKRINILLFKQSILFNFNL